MAGLMDLKLLKCKNCGEPLDIRKAHDGVVVCETCDYSNILPKANATDKVRELLSHGNSFLDTAKFEDAYTMFAKAAEEDPEEPEAHFGMALAEYKVQYVNDLTKDGRRRLQAIVHSVSPDNFVNNVNYRRALLKATETQKAEYEKRAGEIDYIRDQFYRFKNAGLKYDCFICVKVTDPNDPARKTLDSVKADEICTYLKRKGFRPFYSEQVLQDVAGCDYEAHILYALYTAECFLLVCFDESYLRTKWVRNEYMRFLKLVNDEEKESDSITFVYDNRPIEKLPGKNGKIQGISARAGDSFDQIYRFVERHTPEARRRKEEEERARKEAEDKRVAAMIEQKMRQANIGGSSTPAQPIKPLLTRASQELSMGRLDKANEYYNRVLDVQPECAEAWFGMMMLEFDCKNERELYDKIDSAYTIDENKNKLLFRVINSQYGAQVKKYADSALLVKYNSIIEACNKPEGWFRMMLQEMECRSDRELLDKIKRSYCCDKKKTDFLNKFRTSKYGERVRNCATGDLKNRYDALYRASNDAESWYKVWLLEFGCSNDLQMVQTLKEACCLDEKKNALLFKFRDSEYGRAVASCASGDILTRYKQLMRECDNCIEALRQGASAELEKVQASRKETEDSLREMQKYEKQCRYTIELGNRSYTKWWLKILIFCILFAGAAVAWFFALGSVFKYSMGEIIASGEKFKYTDLFKLDKLFGGGVTIKDFKEMGIPAFTCWGITIIKGKATLGFVIEILAYSLVTACVLAFITRLFRWRNRVLPVIFMIVAFSVAWFFIFARYWMAHFDIGNNYLNIFKMKLSDSKDGLLKMSELADYGVSKFGGWGLTIGPGVIVQPIVCGVGTAIVAAIVLSIFGKILRRHSEGLRKDKLTFKSKYKVAKDTIDMLENSTAIKQNYDNRIQQMNRIIGKCNSSFQTAQYVLK